MNLSSLLRQKSSHWAIGLFVLITVCSPLLVENIQAETSSVVATCPGPTENYRQVFDVYSESFKPTVNTLTNLSISLQTVAASGVSAKFGITKSPSDSDNALVSKTADVSSGINTYEFSFDPLTVEPDTTYYLFVKKTGEASFGWGASYDANCYASGSAYRDPFFAEYLFAVSGYNKTVETTPATASSTPASSQESSPSPAESKAPSAPTIQPPTGLAGADVTGDQGGAVKLDWKKSVTADIEGYKIYRSNEEKKGFVGIGSVDKNTITYTDSQAEIGKIYFYYVRAFKGSVESKNSSTISASSVDNLAPATPSNFRARIVKEDILLEWDANTEIDLVGYDILISEDEAGTVGVVTEIAAKDAIEYTLKKDKYPNLDNYYFSLKAKDAHGNLSPATAIVRLEKEKTVPQPEIATADEKRSYVIYIVVAFLILAAAGSGYYYYRRSLIKKKSILLQQ